MKLLQESKHIQKNFFSLIMNARFTLKSHRSFPVFFIYLVETTEFFTISWVPICTRSCPLVVKKTRYLTVVKTWARQAAARSRQYLTEKYALAKKLGNQQSTFYAKADIGITIYCKKYLC
jgi:hypothetical protein